MCIISAHKQKYTTGIHESNTYLYIAFLVRFSHICFKSLHCEMSSKMNCEKRIGNVLKESFVA